MNARRTIRASRRGFTLMEAVACIVVLAILIPPSVAMLRDAAAARTRALDISRATWLANAVVENVIADVSSPTIGMSALNDANVYLTTPTTGLYARLEPVTLSYAPRLSYSVDIGPLVDASGLTTNDSTRDLYRAVTVTVSWSEQAGVKNFQMSTFVTNLRSG